MNTTEISVSIADRDYVTNSFKKQEKYRKKDIKRPHMNTERFYKLASKALKKSDIKITAKKTEDSYASNYDSESDLDTIVKQQVHRYDPREKSDHKKRAAEKYLRVKKSRIDSKTGDWLWEYTYHHQEYKDELIEGPYGSNIDSSEDK